MYDVLGILLYQYLISLCDVVILNIYYKCGLIVTIHI